MSHDEEIVWTICAAANCFIIVYRTLTNHLTVSDTLVYLFSKTTMEDFSAFHRKSNLDGLHRPTRPWYTFKCASGLGNAVQSWK